MTWSEFNTLVRKHLTAYNRVQGVQDWIDLLIKAGTLDVQRAVPFYQKGNTTTPVLTPGTYSSTGALPAGTVTGVSIVKGEESNKLEQFPYDRAVLEGTLTGSGIMLDLTGRTFWVFPEVPSDAALEIEWTGVKTDYSASDVVPFDEPFAQAVSEYVLSRLIRQVDQDIGMAQSYANSFSLLKRQLHSDTNANHVLQTS